MSGIIQIIHMIHMYLKWTIHYLKTGYMYRLGSLSFILISRRDFPWTKPTSELGVPPWRAGKPHPFQYTYFWVSLPPTLIHMYIHNNIWYSLVGGLVAIFYCPIWLGNVIVPIDELHHFSEGWGGPTTKQFRFAILSYFIYGSMANLKW